MRRVVITGVGVVSPIGIGCDVFWRNSLLGVSGVVALSRLDTTPFSCKVGGEVKDFVAADYITHRTAHQSDRCTHMGMAACDLALRDAALFLDNEDPSRVGMCFGNVLGGMDFAEPQMRVAAHLSPSRVSPFQSIAWFYAATQGQWSIAHSIQGYAKTIVADRASGLQAVGWGARAIQNGHCDVAFAGGFEAPFVEYAYSIHEASGILATADGERDIYRPFDPEATGTVLGEGAAIVILEERQRALRRRARCYAEVSGFAVTRSSVSHDCTSVTNRRCERASIDALSRCFVSALREAGRPLAHLDYFCADGIAIPPYDAEELIALEKVCNPQSHVCVSAPKSRTGHLLGAAGALDVVWTALMVANNIVLPTTATRCRQSPPSVKLVFAEPVNRRISLALCCGRGIDGLNTALALSDAYESER